MLRIKLITIILFFVCCQNTQTERSVVSRVFDNYLYLDELPDLPESVDSLIFIQNYINQWATKKLLLNKAEFNLDKESKLIDSLVKLYQESLLIHYYKEAVIQNYLDTIISDSLVFDYYNQNMDNFTLQEDIVKLNYIKIKHVAPNLDFVSENFKSFDLEQLDELEEYCLQFAERFFLGDVDWVSWSDFSKKLPIYDSHIFEKQRVILKKNKTMEFSDSIYKYFVFIEDFKLKGTSSPLEYVSSLIQKILINKRKKELINTIEQKLIEEAFSNNNFEIYE